MKEPEAAAAGTGTPQMSEKQTETHTHTTHQNQYDHYHQGKKYTGNVKKHKQGEFGENHSKNKAKILNFFSFLQW